MREERGRGITEIDGGEEGGKREGHEIGKGREGEREDCT